jgi:hypothetical protein
MRSLLIALVLLLASPALAFNVTVTIPDTAGPELVITCASVEQEYRAKPPTNPECAAMLIRIGQIEVKRKQALRDAESAKRALIAERIAEVTTVFPEPLRPAVCGDGEIDASTNEECDDGVGNSNTTPDACRLSCRNAYCGDGVVDTGEVCDGVGCLPDCSALE